MAVIVLKGLRRILFVVVVDLLWSTGRSSRGKEPAAITSAVFLVGNLSR